MLLLSDSNDDEYVRLKLLLFQPLVGTSSALLLELFLALLLLWVCLVASDTYALGECVQDMGRCMKTRNQQILSEMQHFQC